VPARSYNSSQPHDCRPEADLDHDGARTTTGDVDDAVLLASIQRGDQQAVAALYDRYSGVAYGLAFRITNDGTLAEDVVQDAFVSVWKQAARFDTERGKVKSWLLTIVHHKAIDAVRRKTNRKERALPEGPGDFVAAYGRPHEETSASMDADAVRAAVRLVPEDQRRTIEMAYFEGLTHLEIAERMQVPLGTVKSRLRIGLEKMRDALRVKVLELE
jgi:RNA polymerase sigma-70 factor (ECF subfamily)